MKNLIALLFLFSFSYAQTTNYLTANDTFDSKPKADSVVVPGGVATAAISVTPEDAWASFSGKTIKSIQWQKTKIFQGLTLGEYTLRCRMENCPPLDTVIVVKPGSPILIRVSMHESGNEVSVNMYNQKLIQVPSNYNGKEWYYSFIFAGLGQLQADRTQAGSLFGSVEAVALITDGFSTFRYGTARREYQDVIDQNKNATLNKNKAIVLDKEKTASQYYNMALTSLVVAGFVHLVSILEAYLNQPSTSTEIINPYAAALPDGTNSRFVLGVKVRL